MRGTPNTVTKAHYQGENEDFIVFIDDFEQYKKWKGDSRTAGDKSIPITEFVGSYKVFVTHKHGSQGTMDGASKSALEDAFGTSREDDVVIKILEADEGPNGPLKIVQSQNKERGGDRNDTIGGTVAH